MITTKEVKTIWSTGYVDYISFIKNLTTRGLSLKDFAESMEKVYGYELAILRREDILSSPEGTAKRPDVPPTVGEILYPELSWEILQEYNRTMMFCYLFYLVAHDEYELFTECQPDAIKLSRSHFDEIVVLAESVLEESEGYENYINILMMSDLLMADASIHDIGKVRGIAEIYNTMTGSSGSELADHDEPLNYLLENCPEKISRVYLRMNESQQEHLKAVLKIKYNLGQLPQGENLAGNLAELVGIDSKILNFWILKSLLDIAGAAGAGKQNGSVICIEPFYKGFKIAIETVCKIAGGADAESAYGWHLQKRAEILGTNTSSVENYAKIRLACMNRLFDPSDYQFLSNAFDRLEQKETLTKILNVHGTRDANFWFPGCDKESLEFYRSGRGILPYYAPAYFANAKMTDYGKSINREQLYFELLTVFTKALSKYQSYWNARDGYEGVSPGVVSVLNLEALATQSKVNPQGLMNLEFGFEEVGDNAILKIK